MARMRYIKPEFWTDEKVVELSPLARLLFIGIWNFVDDYGRVPFSAARLKMQIFPADSIEVSPLLEEIQKVGMIEIYDVDNKRYLQVANFKRHQITKDNAVERYPAPPKSLNFSTKVLLDKEKDKEKEKELNAPNGARQPDLLTAAEPDPEFDLYRRGKQVLGKAAGGMIKQLLVAKDGKIPLARAAIETAATKENAREYIGAIIAHNRDPPDRQTDPRL